MTRIASTTAPLRRGFLFAIRPLRELSGWSAGSGNRTRMALRPADFESAAYTSSAIPAMVRGRRLATRCPAAAKPALSRKGAGPHNASDWRDVPSQCLAAGPRLPKTMSSVRNVLFIMCDQLRRDFVSCYGDPRSQRPTSTALRARGVRFDHAYVQSGVCGPSRMSYYTGRYVASHGATWNLVPLSAPSRRSAITCAPADAAPRSPARRTCCPTPRRSRGSASRSSRERGALLREGGFVVVDRYDGHTPPGSGIRLRATGCVREATTAPIRGATTSSPRRTAGASSSGWHMRNVHLPARVTEEHSETAYMTDRALDWIRAQRRSARGCCIFRTSSRTGPMSRRRRTTRSTAAATSARSCAGRRTGPRTSTRSCARTGEHDEAPELRARGRRPPRRARRTWD